MLKLIIIYFIIAHIFNWYTTIKVLVDNSQWFYPGNPLFGEHPTNTTIGFYFIFTGVVALIVVLDILPIFWGMLGLAVYGTLNIVLGIRDLVLLGRLELRPRVPQNIRAIKD